MNSRYRQNILMAGFVAGYCCFRCWPLRAETSDMSKHHRKEDHIHEGKSDFT
jgi:hypothetical protein